MISRDQIKPQMKCNAAFLSSKHFVDEAFDWILFFIYKTDLHFVLFTDIERITSESSSLERHLATRTQDKCVLVVLLYKTGHCADTRLSLSCSGVCILGSFA